MPSRNSRQLVLPIPSGHGGRRPGAGRPKSSEFQCHVRRDRFSAREPLHITLRLRDGLPSLRKKQIYACLRAAVAKARLQGLAIAQFAILSNHVHLIVEATSLAALSRQMQSLCISFAKRLNGLLKSTGLVFRERYHLHVLRTPKEVLHALRYVLSNEAKHLQRVGKSVFLLIRFDPFSSSYLFDELSKLFHGQRHETELSGWDETIIEGRIREFTREPRSWLLTQGWRRAAQATGAS